MNSGYHGSTALTQDMSKTGDSMSCAKAGFQSSTVKSLSAAILGSAPMRLNNNIASAALGTEGLATISEQVCITAFKQKLLFACDPHQPDCFVQTD